jgi:peptide subunit release factor 1 (eRF1)
MIAQKQLKKINGHGYVPVKLYLPKKKKKPKVGLDLG